MKWETIEIISTTCSTELQTIEQAKAGSWVAQIVPLEDRFHGPVPYSPHPTTGFDLTLFNRETKETVGGHAPSKARAKLLAEGILDAIKRLEAGEARMGIARD